MRIKVLIYLAVWKRPEITELCFQGIDRLRGHPDFDIDALAVISEKEMESLCDQYAIRYVTHPNLPLGKKKNFGLNACEKLPFDYLMEIGSDDLVLNDLLDAYRPLIGKWDFFGVRDIAYVDSVTGACRRYTSSKSTYGAGRMISRKALQMVNWKLWRDDLNKGMDNNSVMNLAKAGVFYKFIPLSEYPMVIDVKSKDNIWPFNHLLGNEYSLSEAIKRLSETEKRTLSDIINANRKNSI